MRVTLKTKEWVTKIIETMVRAQDNYLQPRFLEQVAPEGVNPVSDVLGHSQGLEEFGAV